MTCLFCKIVAGEIPAQIVVEGEHVVAFRDIDPKAPTHVLVIPRHHVERIADVKPSDAPWLTELFEVAARIAEDEGLQDGFRLVVNNGEQAGQSVDHVHLHVLGGRDLSWPPG